MGKLIETVLVWAALPYLAIAALGITMKWPLIVLGVVVAFFGLPILGGFIYGLCQGFGELRREKKEWQRLEERPSLIPPRLDGPPTPATPSDIKAARCDADGLPSFPHQWRARLK